MRPSKFGVGQAIRRVEDARLIAGEGHYTSDYRPDRVLHAHVLRSPHAHARFSIRDVAAARAVKGVRLILTAQEVTHLGPVPCLAPVGNSDGSKAPMPRFPLLAEGVVRHVGDAIAFIVADSVNAARDAAEAIEIEWEVLPAVADVRAALAPDAPRVWPEIEGNLAYDTQMGDAARVEAAFAKADRVVRLELENNRLITNYMETRGCVAEYDPGAKSYTLTLGSQGVHGLRDTIAKGILKIDPKKLRVVTPDVGGGFGTKSFVYREYPLCAEAARLLRRPVSWVADRSDHFLADAHGRDNVTVAEVALSARGKFLAMRFDLMGNLGSYLHQYGPYIHYLGATMLTGVYATPAIHVRVRGLFTNTVPVDAYRGAGRPEAAYVLERLVDTAARELGLKPEAIRRRNFIRPDQMPYATPVGGRTYDTGDFDAHMTRAMEAADWEGFPARLKASRKAGKLRGIGLATYIECTAWGSGEDVDIVLERDGTVTLYSGTQSNGQGHATAYAQFAADLLDLPPDQVKVVQGDTSRVATGNGTGGSRSIPVGGISTHLAATDLAQKIKSIAADMLETGVSDLEIVGGAVEIAGTDRRVTFADVAKHPRASVDARTGKGSFVPPDATYPNGTHIAEVEVDPDTGTVSFHRYTICDDFGLAVNPMLLAGQVHGGIAQGIGQALMEKAHYDADGQLLTASLLDYALPRADDLPSFAFETRNVPSTSNPLGIKGAGEAGSIGACPAVMNALVDALHRAKGITHIDMPATPNRIFTALHR
jgi:carbon-monoxide dehydrogenase large subunit